MQNNPDLEPKTAGEQKTNDITTAIVVNDNKKRKLVVLAAVLLGLVFLVATLFFMFFDRPKQMTYEDFLNNAEDIAAWDRYAAESAEQSIEDEVGGETYDALVLGIDVDESDPLYQTQQAEFASAVEAAEIAAGNVRYHEDQIRARGGIATLDDLGKTFTGKVDDPVAFESITGVPADEATIHYATKRDSLRNQAQDADKQENADQTALPAEYDYE